MSELRDLTEVFRAIQASLKDIGEHVASQDANCKQLRENLHDLKNHVAARDLNAEEHFEKVNQWMKTFDMGLKALSDSVAALQSSLADHRREIGRRLRNVEDPEEVTSPGVPGVGQKDGR
ncbi:MAG TPA: hypothetical protein VF077_09695 [Nitrospiraceae bacterium]